MIVAYIDAHKDEFGVEPACRQLQVAPRDLLALVTSRLAVLVIGALEDGPQRFGALRRRLEGVSNGSSLGRIRCSSISTDVHPASSLVAETVDGRTRRHSRLAAEKVGGASSLRMCLPTPAPTRRARRLRAHCPRVRHDHVATDPRTEATRNLADFRADRLQEVADQLEGSGTRVVTLDLDLTDEDSCRRAAQRTTDELGAADVLVNNAGVMLLGPILDADTEDWRRMMAPNVLGLMYMTHAVLPAMVRRGSGSIVTMSSVAARVPGPASPPTTRRSRPSTPSASRCGRR